jgi:hypothetical protein
MSRVADRIEKLRRKADPELFALTITRMTHAFSGEVPALAMEIARLKTSRNLLHYLNSEVESRVRDTLKKPKPKRKW